MIINVGQAMIDPDFDGVYNVVPHSRLSSFRSPISLGFMLIDCIITTPTWRPRAAGIVPVQSWSDRCSERLPEGRDRSEWEQWL